MEVCSSTEMGASGASDLGTGDRYSFECKKCGKRNDGHFEVVTQDKERASQRVYEQTNCLGCAAALEQNQLVGIGVKQLD